MSHVKFKRYDAYKDSGVEWLGEVPAHWDLQRFKSFVDILSGYSPEKVKPDLYGNIAYYKVDDLNSLSKTGHITKSTWRTNYTKCVYQKNVLLLPKRGMSILTNKIGITNKNCIFDTNLMGLRLSPKYVDIKFIFYWIVNVGLSKLADITTIPQLNNKHIYPIVIQLPKRAEQTTIAAYLDTKTAHIDRKIDLLSQKAAQYGMLKQSLINETVTRGLDKSVAMKDSGVDWIGEVPKHWEIKRLKDVINLRSGDSGISKSDTGTFPIYGANGIIGMCDFYNQSENRILIGRVGTSGAITEAFEKYVVSDNAFIITLSKHVLYKFMFYRSVALTIESLSSKNAQPLLTGTSVKNLLSSFPTLSEQQAIADYLDEKITHIDRIVETIHTQIDKLKELRKTLINDVVTGKIKVE